MSQAQVDYTRPQNQYHTGVQRTRIWKERGLRNNTRMFTGRRWLVRITQFVSKVI